MRKDIGIDINDGSFVMKNMNDNRYIYKSNIVDKNQDDILLDSNIYICVHIDDNVVLDKDGVFINIPYTPIEKYAYVCFSMEMDNGSIIYILNPTTNSKWFKIYSNNNHMVISKIPLINRDGNLHLIYNDNGYMNAYDFNSYDFNISESLYQDAQTIIKNYITSNSRHPLAGVGIQKYLNSPVIDKKLSNRVLSELNSDGIIPKSVVISGGLIALDLDEKNNSLGYEEKQQIR